MHAAERHDARNAAAGPHDHLAADLLAENAIRRADVSPRLGRHRGGLQAESVLADRLRRLVHDRVVGRSPPRQREVEAGEVDREADHIGGEYAQRLLEQFLPRLVTLEHDDRPQLHEPKPTVAGVRPFARQLA